MIVVAFCVVAIVTALLIYFVLRTQTLQNELAQTRATAKASARKVHIAFTNLVLVTSELHKVIVRDWKRPTKGGCLRPHNFKWLTSLLNIFPEWLWIVVKKADC